MPTRLSLMAAALVTALAVAVATAEEKAIPVKQLPAPVRKAADANLQGGVIKSASMEVEKGETVYEVETTRAGHGRDLLFSADGTLIEVEEEMALDDVPPAVQAALAAHGRIIKVESVVKGAAVSYEGLVERGGKRSEVVVGADGKPVVP